MNRRGFLAGVLASAAAAPALPKVVEALAAPRPTIPPVITLESAFVPTSTANLALAFDFDRGLVWVRQDGGSWSSLSFQHDPQPVTTRRTVHLTPKNSFYWEADA